MDTINPLPLRLAQTLGITSSAVLAGSTLSLSIYLIPRLLESPTPLLLKQWAGMYHAGKSLQPPLAVFAASSFFYLAYALPSTSAKSVVNRYIAAGVLSAGIVPYTIAFLAATNKKLLKKAEETKTLGKTEEIVEAGLGDETAHKLVDWWGIVNLGRGLMLGAAAVLGAWTALE